MDTVVLVQCTQLKRPDGAPARDLYDRSDYFVKQRDYAEVVGDRWFVQSAEYGLLAPDDGIGPYNTTPDDIGDVGAWAAEIAGDLDAAVHDDPVIHVLGGRKYADPLTPELERHGYEVHEPLRGLGIGERKAELTRLVNVHTNEQIV